MEKRIITRLHGKICTALIRDGEAEELMLEEEGSSTVNHIYVGRVQKVVPGINAAFVDGFFMGNGGEAFDRGVLPPYHRSQRGEMVCWLIPIWKKEPSG